MHFTLDNNEGDDDNVEGDDNGNKDAESDVDDDDSNDDDMEGEDFIEGKVLRHQHECQELPVQAQEDSKREDTDQGNKQK